MAARKKNLVTIAGSVTPEVRATFEERKWDERCTLSELVAKALEEYLVNHDIPLVSVTPDAAAAPAEKSAPKSS